MSASRAKDDADPDDLTLSLRVPATAAGQKLLAFLARRFPYRSPSQWAAEVAAGRIRVDGAVAAADRVLRTGARLAHTFPHREPPVNADVRILHEDEHLVVVDKPAPLPTHADGPFVRHTLWWILTQRLASGSDTTAVRLVHRLDRETSGVLVAARTKRAARDLARQFEGGLVEKEYLAVVAGVVAAHRFTVDGPLGRDPASRIAIRRALVAADAPGAQPSRTDFEVVERLDGATIVRALPRTGRTHQIRVHLAACGHPIVADKLYGRTDDEYLEYVAHVKAGGDQAFGERMPAPRQLLHAAALRFTHPATRERLTFTAATPEDLRQFCAAL